MRINPKFEYRNTKQIQISNVQNEKTTTDGLFYGLVLNI